MIKLQTPYNCYTHSTSLEEKTLSSQSKLPTWLPDNDVTTEGKVCSCADALSDEGTSGTCS